MHDSQTNPAPYRLIWLVLLLFVGLATAASVVNPLHEATDELRHYRFVQHMIQRQSLPVQGAVGCSAQGHHPPLFYGLAALATFWVDTGQDVCFEPEINPFWNYRQWEVGVDNKNLYLPTPDNEFPWWGASLAAHLTRLVNVLIGAGTVYLTWLIGRTLWPKRPFLALGGAAFIAFNPMFVYMAGATNNDVIAAFSGTAVLLACIKLVQDERGLSRRWALILGVLFSMALLSKFNLLAIGGVIAVAATYVAWRRKQWRQWVELIVIAGVVTAALSGWWFVRNQLLYGEPTGVQRLTELWGVRDPSESWGVAIFELKPTWTSLWGRFGYGQIPLPEPIYIVLLWVIGVGLVGLLVPLLRRNEDDRKTAVPILLLLLNMLLFFVVVFNYLLISPAGAMGRFFFPALSSLSIVAFYGLSNWFSLIHNSPFTIHNSRFLTGVTYIGMITLTAAAIFGYLRPAYAAPPKFDAQTAVPNPVNVQFDVLATLRGYDIRQTAVSAGGPLDIDLYWEVDAPPPGNYLLFVHVMDAELGTMIVQRDTHPGLGNAPSRHWQVGDTFVDSIRVWLPETAYTPTTANVSIGLYVPDAYRLGITGADGNGIGDALQLGQVEIRPFSTPDLAVQFPNPLNQNFNNEIRLVGYEYSQRRLRPGDALVVTLDWQALQTAPTNYRVQVWLIDEAGVPIVSSERVPEIETAVWQQGQLVPDRHVLRLGSEIMPGTYRIHVALIDSVTNDPQNIVAEDGHWIDNRLLLDTVRVRPIQENNDPKKVGILDWLKAFSMPHRIN